MKPSMRQPARRYAATLRKYLANEREAVLEQAYELGRAAIAEGFGILDMMRFHQEALRKVWSHSPDFRVNGSILKAAEIFFAEALSPFEAAHRGFRETAAKLLQRNRELETEIAERKRTEKVLRELFNETRQMEENLRSLSSQVLHVQEQERKQISRELHDEVGQALTAISMTLAAVKDTGASRVTPVRRKISEAQQLLQQTMEIVHDFALELRPAMLDELGLLPTLRSHLKGFAKRTGLRVRFRGNLIVEKLGNTEKTVLFRVAQESLNNVAKHAGANHVRVIIRKAGDDICMEVVDDGKSFRVDPVNSVRKNKRLGLLGMQERLRLVNGRFAIKPEPGRGTTVRALIPFSSDNHRRLSGRR